MDIDGLQLSEVPMDKSIKDLVGGKSTLQNEILGDISAELAASSMPERVEELALADVADKLKGSGRLGKFFSGKCAKQLSPGDVP
jgi:3-oxoacyl-ACP reductase-like protein